MNPRLGKDYLDGVMFDYYKIFFVEQVKAKEPEIDELELRQFMESEEGEMMMKEQFRASGPGSGDEL